MVSEWIMGFGVILGLGLGSRPGTLVLSLPGTRDLSPSSGDKGGISSFRGSGLEGERGLR